MIKIEFELKDKENILIFGIDEKGIRKEIGQIFTPSGSGKRNSNAIQICGFNEAFDLWSCGIYGNKVTGKMKRDIQLMWNGLFDQMNDEEIRRVKVGEVTHPLTTKQMKELGLTKPFFIENVMKDRFSIDGDVCEKCFNYPCNCEVKTAHENPFTVKREQDLWLYTREEYQKAMKNVILDNLEK